MPNPISLLARCTALFVLLATTNATAHAGGVAMPPPAALAVQAKLSPPTKGVVDLKFGDMFTLPVGPRGLEPSDKLRRLDGQRVRLIGYMVQIETPSSGSFLLSPLPVAASEEDEPLADDIPASTVLIRVGDHKPTALPNLVGLIRLTGVLHVGTTSDDASGRNAAASLELDAACTRALRRAMSTPPRRPAQAPLRHAVAPARDTRASPTSD